MKRNQTTMGKGKTFNKAPRKTVTSSGFDHPQKVLEVFQTMGTGKYQYVQEPEAYDIGGSLVEIAHNADTRVDRKGTGWIGVRNIPDGRTQDKRIALQRKLERRRGQAREVTLSKSAAATLKFMESNTTSSGDTYTTASDKFGQGKVCDTSQRKAERLVKRKMPKEDRHKVKAPTGSDKRWDHIVLPREKCFSF